MKHKNRPTLLLLTSSFPSSSDDQTCGYVRDFARSLASAFDVEILAPPSRRRSRQKRASASFPLSDGGKYLKERDGGADTDSFALKRSWSILPRAVDPFTADADLNQITATGLLTRLAATISIACFFLRAVVLSRRADAVCSHWMVPCGLAGAVISRMRGTPHIVIEHSGGLHLLRRMASGRFIAQFIVGGSYRVITVSRDLKHKLLSLVPDAATKTQVISMGVDRWRERGASSATSRTVVAERPRPFRILFIGRLTRIKGLEVLLKAIGGLAQFELTVAGDGELRRELEQISRELSARTSFIGRVSADRRQTLLADCDAVVIPSRKLDDGRTEGTPLVCLEAMSAGRLVIASRVGGLAEVIVDGLNGLLFDEGDHQMLREKLMLALGDDRLRRMIADNGQQSAEAYGWPAVAPRFIQIISDSLGNGSNPQSQRSALGNSE